MFDAINSGFECVAAVFVWSNFFRLLRDREIKGVYWPATGFTAVWGIWSLVYYASLEHWFSFCANVVLCAGNVAWVTVAIGINTRKR